MKRIFRVLLLVWGGLSLAATISVAAYVGYQLKFGNQPKANSTSPQDVRFVLNWCRLGDNRIKQVIHSYESSRSFTGDYLDAYAIKISHVDTSELKPPENESRSGWYRCDQLPPVVSAALDYVAGYSGWEQISWFPKPAELRSHNFYVYPWSIYFHGVDATAAELIFVRPSDNMVFYIGSKT
jgi:hypothetical protein